MAAREEVFIAPATVSACSLDTIHILQDRYTVSFDTSDDIHQYADRIAGTGSTQYTVKHGTDWSDAGPRETVETAEHPLTPEDDAVYLQQGTMHDRYLRSYFAPDDQDDAEIMITVPATKTRYDVTPLYDALDPFFDDLDIIDAVDAVEQQLNAYEDGDIDPITLPS